LRRIDDFGSGGRERTGAGIRHGKGLGEAAIDGDGVEAAEAVEPAVAEGAEDDAFAVVGPAVDLVIVAPARRERSAGGIEGQLTGLAAGGGHDVDLLIAVVLAGEGDPFAVGRELGEEFHAGMRGEARGSASACGCGP